MAKNLIFITVFLILIPSLSFGEIYKWKDENGKTHFTNDPTTIPLENRERGVGRIREAPPATGGLIHQHREPVHKSEALREYERIQKDNQIVDNALKVQSCAKKCASKFFSKSKNDEALLKCAMRCKRERNKRVESYK